MLFDDTGSSLFILSLKVEGIETDFLLKL